jgi:twitching motility protein PilT
MNLLDVMAGAFMLSDAREFAVASGRYPCVKIAGEYKPLGKQTATDDHITEMVLALGGLPHADAIAVRPTTWRASDDTLGPLQVTAARRNGVLQVRVVAPSPTPTVTTSSAPTAVAAATARAPVTAIRALSRLNGPALADDDDDEIPAVFQTARGPAVALVVAQQVPATGERPAALEENPPALSLSLAPAPSAVAPSAAKTELRHWLSESRRAGASDLHIVAARPVLLRVGGDLRPTGDALTPAVVEHMLLAAIPAHLLSGFHREGSCDFAIDEAPNGRFRVNISRQRTGLKASLRLIGFETPTLEGLGLPSAIANATHHHQGLIVVTGPTGHGKTSTLAAIVNLMNTETKHHIITVEDPIEYLHGAKKALMSQREVGTHTRSFASALKASLREDPDVIVVGELRDTETVRMALSASETGHLVVATMNTPSAAKTIDRLIDLFPPADQPQVRMGLAGGLRLIVSQRLLRGADGTRVFAAAELLPGNVALWNLIRENKTYQIPSLQQRGKSLGIIRLDDSLIELVRAGKVTLDEARASAESPDEITAAITGQRPAAKRVP